MTQGLDAETTFIEGGIDRIFSPNDKITIRSLKELSTFFTNKLASQSRLGDGLTKLVCLKGPDFTDPDKTYDFILQLIENLKSKKQICLFTPYRFTVEMPASDEHALTSAEFCSLLKTAIRTQLFGLSESDSLPIRINFQQEGVVKLAGRHQPVFEPDFKIAMGRGIIPFLLGEVGVSDRLNYTKLKSKLWIERGGGDVKLSIAVKIDLDSAVSRKIIGMRVIVYRLEETAKVLRRGGAPVINRTAMLIAETDYGLYFGTNLTPPQPPPVNPPPPIRIPSYLIADGITGIPRPIRCEYVELDVERVIQALI